MLLPTKEGHWPLKIFRRVLSRQNKYQHTARFMPVGRQCPIVCGKYMHKSSTSGACQTRHAKTRGGRTICVYNNVLSKWGYTLRLLRNDLNQILTTAWVLPNNKQC